MYENVKNAIRDIPDFPKKGIIFKDVTTAIKRPEIFKEIIDFFVNELKNTDFDYIAAIESRGFFLASPIAYLMGKGLILIRKPGKLPSTTYKASYELEYGTDSLEIHTDAIENGKKVVIMDDLIATGGTLGASIDLIKQSGAIPLKALFLIELEALKGRERFESQIDIISMLKF